MTSSYLYNATLSGLKREPAVARRLLVVAKRQPVVARRLAMVVKRQTAVSNCLLLVVLSDLLQDKTVCIIPRALTVVLSQCSFFTLSFLCKLILPLLKLIDFLLDIIQQFI